MIHSAARSLILGVVVVAIPCLALAMDSDSDGDGLTDADETSVYFTDPDDPDSDDDLLLDGFEVAHGFDPLDSDEDTNGKIDGRDDADADALGNSTEQRAGTDPNDADSDDDGLEDGEELGDGSFGAQLVIGSGAAVEAVLAADIDGDGDADVLYASSIDDTIAWFENTDGAGSFGPEQVITTLADSARSAAAADVDGDGDLDVVGAALLGDEISWYANADGAGSFGPKQVISTATDQARWVFASDIDGDGDVDVLSASSLDDKIAWYANTTGGGAFGPQQLISTTADSARSVFAADLDGDGDADALSASYGDDTIAWYENTNGAGSFGAAQVITTLADGANTVIAADVDGDGDPDVLSASSVDDELAWYENTNGAGSFSSQQVISNLADGASSIFAADVDGDGDLDALSASSSDDKIAWYENTDGSGSFGTETVISTAADVASSVFAADLDGDGDMDALSGSWSPGNLIAWYENVNVADPLDSDTDDDGLNDGDEVDLHATDPSDPDTDADGLSDGDEINVYGSDPLDTDSDGDGLDDGTEVQVHGTDPADDDSDGDGLRDGFEVEFGFDPLLGGEEALDTDLDGLVNLDEQTHDVDPLRADTDGDGLTDGDEVHVHGTAPASADTDGDELPDAYEVAHGFDPLDPDEDANGTVDGQDDSDADGLGNSAERRAGTDPNDADTDDDGLEDGEELGDGSFGPQQVITTLTNQPQSVYGADLDGDGDTDVLSASSQDSELAWYENTDGQGSFGAQQIISSAASSARSVVAADLDGDGDQDAVVGLWYQWIAWHENTDGAGSFGPQQLITSEANGTQSIFAADLDGDWDADVLSAAYNDEIAWYENADGAGGFGPQQVISTLADGASSVFAADLDGDGDLDALSASTVDDETAWYENTDGKGSFGAQQVISNQGGGSAVYAADLDGDGDSDVLAGGAELAWYENTDGQGSFGPQQLIAPPTGGFIHAADVDGDGDIDVLSASGNDVAWYENTDGSGSFGPQQIISDLLQAAAEVFATDVDGDGDIDVLSASGNDDKIAWYENLSLSDPLDADSDDDGLSDGDEVDVHGTDPKNADSDGDGLSDGDEVNVHATDPLDIESDGDGLADGDEVQSHGTDPADSDSDDDGLHDGFEVDAGFDPLVGGEQGLDPDLDGLVNLDEQTALADPLDPDSDGDGLSDGDEFHTHGTSPVAVDSDGDELRDDFELAEGFSPTNPDEDANGTIDGRDDADSDGLGNAAEQRAGTDLTDDDSDDDGLLDGEELATGTFGSAQLISAIGSFDSVSVADVDGDGDVDAVAASQVSDELSWYENTDGAGSFGAKQIVSASLDGPVSVVASDLDGDGDLDVLSASWSSDTVVWYENSDGAGSFGPEQVVSASLGRPLSVVAADFDGDGDDDALSASDLGDSIAWHENKTGKGSFGARQVITTQADFAISVDAADLDGDGDIDALSASRNDSKVAWYENADGVGGFGVQQVISTQGSGANSVFATDVDGDGDTDVLVASMFDDEVAWYENTDGAGSFGAQQVISGAGNGIRVVTAADVDGDGDTDALSAAIYDDTIVWYENTDAAGSFGATRIVASETDFVDFLVAADVDGDGDIDVLASGSNPGLAWYENLNLADPLDSDSDDDGLNDGDEVGLYGSNPLLADTDDDGLTDGNEVSIHGTSPVDPDTDGDGWTDGEEVAHGFDPLNPSDPYAITALPSPAAALLGLLLFAFGASAAARSRRRKNRA